MKYHSLHYDDIPESLLTGKKTILEFGSSNGLNQLISRHREFFIENNKAGRYTGFDIRNFKDVYLNIKRGDIRTYEPDCRYDLVLALHVLEHISLDLWEKVIQHLRAAVALNGALIIGVPNKEPQPDHKNTNHKVFNITPSMLLEYIPNSEIFILPNHIPFPH